MKICFSPQNPTAIKDTILRWCQELTQFYRVIRLIYFIFEFIFDNSGCECSKFFNLMV